MERVYVGLGSNLDSPLEQVRTAVTELAALSGCTLLAQSPWYGSAAIGPGKQPDYVNGVVCLATDLQPHKLLGSLQAIEQAHMRIRQEHWGPRTLDLDLLLYGQQEIHTERLQVPHPWLQQRNFVILPLADVAPELTLPDGVSLQRLSQTVSREGIWRLDNVPPHLNR